jgi:hypothetical protein
MNQATKVSRREMHIPHLKAVISSCFGTGGEGFDSTAKICYGLFQ